MDLYLCFTENRDKKRQQRLPLSTVSLKTGTTEGRLCKHRQPLALLLLVSNATHWVWSAYHHWSYCVMCQHILLLAAFKVLILHSSTNLPDGPDVIFTHALTQSLLVIMVHAQQWISNFGLVLILQRLRLNGMIICIEDCVWLGVTVFIDGLSLSTSTVNSVLWRHFLHFIMSFSFFLCLLCCPLMFCIYSWSIFWLTAVRRVSVVFYSS